MEKDNLRPACTSRCPSDNISKSHKHKMINLLASPDKKSIPTR
jgi:hypothetical protein